MIENTPGIGSVAVMIEQLIRALIAVLILCAIGYAASLLVAGVILKIIWVVLVLIGCLIVARIFGLKI